MLGIIQGFTEFVPVSSSGHLVIAEEMLGLKVEELLSFDVMLHAGTLAALVFVFWKKIMGMLKGDYNLFLKLVIATIPAAVAGILFKDYLEEHFRSATTVAVAFVFVAVYFLLTRLKKSNEEKVSWKRVVLMSLAQMVALVPGVSRSGMTVATGEMSGLKREQAAEFSFLMLLPVVSGAVVLVLLKGDLDLSETGNTVLLTGFLASMISSFVFAKLMLKFFKKFGLTVFAIYLLMASSVIFLLQYI